MSYNKELLQTDLESVTKDLMKQAFFLAMRDGVTSVAPLGFSGDTVMLYGTEQGGRKSSVSFRMYCDDVEMLITDIKGSFLFYGRYRKEIGVDTVLNEYWNMFNLVKPFILSELPRVGKGLKISPNVTHTEGWAILNMKVPSKFKPTLFQRFKNWLFVLILLVSFSSCIQERKTVEELREMVRQNKAERKETKVTGVYLIGSKDDHIEVRTEAGIDFRTHDDRIDKYKEGDLIIYYTDKKTGELLGNVLQ